MRTIQHGDIVRVEGIGNGREGTVMKPRTERGAMVHMGTHSIYVSPDSLTIISRARWDEQNNPVEPDLQIGDKVRYTYPNPPADLTHKQPVRYGEVTGFVSEKRVNVRWVGASTDKVERLSRLKWVPMIPGWFLNGYEFQEQM